MNYFIDNNRDHRSRSKKKTSRNEDEHSDITDSADSSSVYSIISREDEASTGLSNDSDSSSSAQTSASSAGDTALNTDSCALTYYPPHHWFWLKKRLYEEDSNSLNESSTERSTEDVESKGANVPKQRAETVLRPGVSKSHNNALPSSNTIVDPSMQFKLPNVDAMKNAKSVSTPLKRKSSDASPITSTPLKPLMEPNEQTKKIPFKLDIEPIDGNPEPVQTFCDRTINQINLQNTKTTELVIPVPKSAEVVTLAEVLGNCTSMKSDKELTGLFELMPENEQNFLPQEVLLTIFKMLPLSDRKNIRLVCKDWYDICAAFEMKAEKICISSFYNDYLNEVLTTLGKSKRRYFNFEFHGLDFKRKPRVVFWRTCGPKILTMKFFHCGISSPPFANILKYCTSLQMLEFDFENLRDLKNRLRISFPSVSIPAGLTNRSLRTLNIHFNTYSQSPYPNLYWLELICLLFRLFPNISNFSFRHRNLYERGMVAAPDKMNSSWLKGEFDLDAHQLQTTLNTYLVRNRMESIALAFLYYPGFNWRRLFFVQGLTKITEISVDMDTDINLELFSNFVLQQVNLRKIICLSDEDNFANEKLVDFIPFVLRRSTLREFSLLLYRAVIKWNYNWSSLLSTSNVEALRIVCRKIDLSGLLSSGLSAGYPLNFNLASLEIRVDKFDPNIARMLNGFCSLKQIKLSHMDSAIMNFLCTNQNTLQSLTANQVIADKNDQPINFPVICQLKKLKELQIPETTILEPNCFRHLKYLRILRPTILQHEVNGFIQKNYLRISNLRTYRCLCPTLEVMWIDCYVPRVFTNGNQFLETIKEFVAEMKALKFLYFAHEYFMMYAYEANLTVEEALQIFGLCPSLEVFIYHDTFVRDTITGIRKIEKNRRTGNDMDELIKKYVPSDDDKWDYQYRSVLYTMSDFN